MPALKKYTKVFDIQGVHQASTRDELEMAVSRHWNATVSWEREREREKEGVGCTHPPLPPFSLYYCPPYIY